MSEDPIVSIITPCFNGEGHVHRLLNSILKQTYSPIEFIFVNDGSIDNTESIVLSYKDKFESKGIKFVYIFQENNGQAGAINSGLKKVTGRYLCWPDSDDYLEPESVELRLQILEEHPEFAIVASDAFFRSVDNLQVTSGLVSANYNNNHDPYQFVHLLNGRSFICSGCYMVRTNAFFETHPSGEILPSRRGQNYQMLLPVYYRYKRYFLNRPLYNYIRSGNSHSNLEYSGLNKEIAAYNHHKEIFLETLSAMDMSEQEKIHFMNIVRIRYSHLIFRVAYNNGQYEMLCQEFINLKKLNQISPKVRLKFVLAGFRQLFLRSLKKDPC